jgi:phytol kinase
MSSAEWIGVVALLMVVSLLFAGLRAYQIKFRPQPELVRKLFHLSGGLFGLPLPWIFDTFTRVLLLGLLIGGVFVALRFVKGFRSGVGQVLFAVQRESIGELCYLASMVLLFWLAQGNKLLYAVPLLMLALADTAAALVGEEYGKLKIHTAGGGKSIEGAIAFFFIAFFCVHVPVLLWGDTGRVESLLIGINLSLMVMMAEAAAWWGVDNLLVPLWGYMLLKSQIHMDLAGLASDLGFLLVLGIILWRWRNRTTLADDTLCGAAMWGYVVWAVGGWRWTLPPLIQLLSYATITFRSPMDQLRVFPFPVVLAQIAGSIFWLLVFRESEEPALFYPFAACFASNVAIIALVRHKYAMPGIGWRQAIAASVAISMVVIIPSVLVVDGVTLNALLNATACLVAVFLAAAIFYRLQPGLSAFPVDGPRWARQAVIVGVTSTVALGIHHGVLRQLRLPTLNDLYRLILP